METSNRIERAGTHRQSTRGRAIAFTRADEAAFSRLLVERFGPALFVNEHPREGANPRYPSLAEPPRDCRIIKVLFPDRDEDWQPKPSRHVPGAVYWNCPRFFWFHRAYWNWSAHPRAIYDPPTLEGGEVNTSFYRDDEHARRFVRALWRLISRFGVSQFAIEYPHLGLTYAQLYGEEDRVYDPKRRPSARFAAGPDAVRWCLAKPTRMIEGRLRPRRGWTFPDWLRPYYRDEELAETDAIGNELPGR